MDKLSGDGAFPVNDLYSFLEGNWQLSRTINDLRQNMPGAMAATASIAKQNENENVRDLCYREEGELHFGDYKEVVYRSYIFRFLEPQKAQVHFDDGRLFHELDLTSGYCEAEHLCGDDIYRGRFRIENRDTWLSNWIVTGPSKELILDNRYQRMSA